MTPTNKRMLMQQLVILIMRFVWKVSVNSTDFSFYTLTRFSSDLLAPLTAAADLPTHASLSHPYLSTTLSDMVQQACDMLHRERKTLWDVKGLLTKLRGDETWIPCGELNSDIDDTIFDTDSVLNEALKMRLRTDSVSTIERKPTNGVGSPPTSTGNRSTCLHGAPAAKAFSTGTVVSFDANPYTAAKNGIKSDPLNSAGPVSKSEERPGGLRPGGLHSPVAAKENNQSAVEVPVPAEDISVRTGNGNISIDANQSLRLDLGNAAETTISSDPMISSNDLSITYNLPDGTVPNQDQFESRAGDKVLIGALGGIEDVQFDQDIVPDAVEGKDQVMVCGGDAEDAAQPISHRMTTRAQAQAASEKSTSSRTRSASPASWAPPSIHPLYLMTPSAHPDRNFGLPPNEAEEIRRTVMMYIQKQEEICRGAEKLYFGLLRADRMRKTVFRWCKAEGHIGEMSDGEDWYDKEEWGLDEDLRKGHDEEEEEAQGKKTRARRT